nr:uncharacterized protein LOC109168481 isoform X1 [Ipomoea batatas]
MHRLGFVFSSTPAEIAVVHSNGDWPGFTLHGSSLIRLGGFYAKEEGELLLVEPKPPPFARAVQLRKFRVEGRRREVERFDLSIVHLQSCYLKHNVVHGFGRMANEALLFISPPPPQEEEPTRSLSESGTLKMARHCDGARGRGGN